MHLPHQRSSAWQPLPPRGGEAKEQAEHALQLTTLEFCCIIRIHLNHGSKLHQNGGPLGGNRKLLLFLSPLWLVGKNIVKCERYPGTRGFDLIEGKQPKSEWNIWRQIKVVYSFQVELSPRQQALAVYSQSSQVFCSDAFSEMEDHWPAFLGTETILFVQPDVKVTSHNIFPKFISKISSNLPQFLLIAYYRGWYDQIAQFTNNCNVLAHHPPCLLYIFCLLGIIWRTAVYMSLVVCHSLYPTTSVHLRKIP